MTEPSPIPRTVPAGRGADWIVEGFALFRRDAPMWIAAALICMIVFVAGSTTSTFMSLVLSLFSPVIAGGLMLGCDAQQRGEPLRIEHLWAGLSDGHAGPLILLGVFSIVGFLLVSLGVVLVVGATVGTALLSGGGLESLEIGESLILATLVAVLVATPVTMALWFAPTLVVLQRMAPASALRASFRASLANLLSMSVNGLLLLVLMLVAVIPFGLGLLVFIPVLTTSVYIAYRDIFAIGSPATEIRP